MYFGLAVDRDAHSQLLVFVMVALPCPNCVVIAAGGCLIKVHLLLKGRQSNLSIGQLEPM